MVTHLLVTASAVDLFIGNTSGVVDSPKYATCVTEMLKNYTVAQIPSLSTNFPRRLPSVVTELVPTSHLVASELHSGVKKISVSPVLVDGRGGD
jgi:hypothetical protein